MRLRRFVSAGARILPHGAHSDRSNRNGSGRCVRHCGDGSVQEGAAVAKRSITRSRMPIYPPITTSDRGNRSPHGSLVTTCPRESGKHACTIRRWAEALARLPHRLGRADASGYSLADSIAPHAGGPRPAGAARTPRPLRPRAAARAMEGCLDGGRRSTRKAVLLRVGFTRPCSRTATAALLGSCLGIGSSEPQPGVEPGRRPWAILCDGSFSHERYRR